jgi:gamma-glutamyltranspeptidase/glutathione hydrolase
MWRSLFDILFTIFAANRRSLMMFCFRRSCEVLIALVLVAPVNGCASAARNPQAQLMRVYAHAAVAADHPVASQAGLEMLKRGGNAVDAAVATSFCLSVVRPYSCGIGGGGFMLIYQPATDDREARAIAIDYRETAPAAVDANYFVNREDKTASAFGHHAVAVPGTVAGLTHALKNYGTLGLATVLEPAIRAADEGFAADANFVNAARELGRDLEKHPHLMKFAAPLWQDVCKSGALQVGDIIRQPQEARALRLIAEQGADAFYRGEIGHAIFATMHTHGGPITMADLKDYAVRERQPLEGRFREHTVLSMPPPSSGGIAMQQSLGILERRWSDLSRYKHNSAGFIHVIVEALKHAFADRARWLADSDFTNVPVQHLLSPGHLDELASRIALDRTSDPQTYGTIEPPPNDGGTSHFCVIDSAGMAVACTETINLNFGSLVTVPGFGFVLNNEMDDFTTVPGRANEFNLTQSDRNLPQGGKRPLSSMSPTIVVKDGRAVLIAGASGGPRIISGTFEAMLNCLVFDMQPQDAVSAPRFHHQWMPDVLQLENGSATEWVKSDLRSRGHELGSISVVGQVQLIRVDADGIRAASDPRKGGTPAGY